MQEARRTLLAAIVVLAAAVPGVAEAQAVVTPVATLRWADAGVPGVSTSQVDGDMKQGASHFFLRYASGFVAPVHAHSADHVAVLVTGTLTLILDGKEHRLTAGSTFSLTGKAPHAARCETGPDCVMFIDAAGPWDVVPAGP